MHCPTFLQTQYIYTSPNSSITTFQELVVAVNDSGKATICVSGSPTGGTLTSCMNVFNEYASASDVDCIAMSDRAFEGLLNKYCTAVFSGFPSIQEQHNFVRFQQPTSTATVSFFRASDVMVNTRQNSTVAPSFDELDTSASSAWVQESSVVGYMLLGLFLLCAP